MEEASHKSIAIIGGGPAGLMAAEIAASQGMEVTVFDAMPSVGRKFLLAGKGGLNLTHAEPFEQLLARYGDQAKTLEPLLRDFGPEAIRAWAQDLGIETFVGTSRRVFPKEMKAAPLLRAWIRHLRTLKVRFFPRHRWTGWTENGDLTFSTPQGDIEVQAGATILCLGGGSWPHLGSDGLWVKTLDQIGLSISPLESSNCGFTVPWSEVFRDRFAGIPIKTVNVTLGQGSLRRTQRGELMITQRGIEGGLVYALSGQIRSEIKQHGKAELRIDLAPDRTIEKLHADLAAPKGKASWSSYLRKQAGLSEVKIGLLRECATLPLESDNLAATIKSLPLALHEPFPISEAISSAGGVCMTEVDENLMAVNKPGLFIAGEMLDWDAPTGGYLLTAALATGHRAGIAAAGWIQSQALSPRT